MSWILIIFQFREPIIQIPGYEKDACFQADGLIEEMNFQGGIKQNEPTKRKTGRTPRTLGKQQDCRWDKMPLRKQ